MSVQFLQFWLIYRLLAILIAGGVHEASHALAAYWLGDPTPRQAGRFSLNPMAHLDPVGTLMLLVSPIGWFKPVMIRAENLKPGPKVGMALVALAGPISNVLLAAILAIPLRFHLLSFLPEPVFQFNTFRLFLAPACIPDTLVSLSLSLAFFNLIPISPLDGSRLWQIILPDRWYWTYARYEVLGLGLILALVFADIFLGTGILNQIIFGPVETMWQMLVGFGHAFTCTPASIGGR